MKIPTNPHHLYKTGSTELSPIQVTNAINELIRECNELRGMISQLQVWALEDSAGIQQIDYAIAKSKHRGDES